MTVILTLKVVHKPHDQKNTRNNILVIKMKVASNERVGGLLGDNISYVPRGVTALGLKAMVSVDNISGIRGGSWGQLMGPGRLLGKFGSKLRI